MSREDTIQGDNLPIPFYAIGLTPLLQSLKLDVPIKKQVSNCTQPAITCSKLTIETLEQGVKYGQS